MVAVDTSSPLTFLSLPPAKSPPTGTGAVFADVSSATYALFTARDILPPPPLPRLPNTPGEILSTTPLDAVGPQAIASAFLLHNPSPGDATRARGDVSAISSIGIHLLHFCATEYSTLRRSIAEFHRELVYNYHDLGVLSRERWGIHFGALPFHLASVQLAQSALEQGKFDQVLAEA